MPDHHVKGQPAASTYVRKKGVSKKTVIVGHPVGPDTEGFQTHELGHNSSLYLVDRT